MRFITSVVIFIIVATSGIDLTAPVILPFALVAVGGTVAWLVLVPTIMGMAQYVENRDYMYPIERRWYMYPTSQVFVRGANTLGLRQRLVPVERVLMRRHTRTHAQVRVLLQP